MAERRRRIAAVVSAMLLCAWAAAAPGQDAERSAYDDLEVGELAKALRRMGMRELLVQLGAELGAAETIANHNFKAALLKDTAAGITDNDARLVKMAAAAGELAKALALAEKAEKEALAAAKRAPDAKRTATAAAAARASLVVYRQMFELGDTLGRSTVEPQAQRVLYLQDNARDRKIIVEKTEEAVELLGDLLYDLKKDIRKWRGVLRFWVTEGPKALQFQKQVQYRSAWTYLYRAMALSGKDPDQKDERAELLEEMLVSLAPFTKSGARAGVAKYWAQWLSAMAYRELGRYGEAVDLLAPVKYQKAPKELRVDVALHLTIALVKQGKFDDAVASIKSFEHDAPLLLGSGSEIMIDLRVALLKNYLYLRWAKASQDAATKAKYDLASQEALLGLLDKYTDPRIQNGFVAFFANKYSYRKDVEKLNSMQLYLLARHGAGRKDPQRQEKLIEEILARTDKVAQRVHPVALWELGMIMNRRRLNVDAAKAFAKIAKEHPKHPRAATAAHLAATSLWRVIIQREKNRRQVQRSLRKDCVAAIELAITFIGKTSKQDAEKLRLEHWYYTLGEQCDKLSWTKGQPQAERLGWMEKAASAFAKVPADPPGKRLEAMNLSLVMHYRLLQARGRHPDRHKMAMAVRQEFRKFIPVAVRAAKDPANKANAAAMMEWAAYADFYAARILAEELNQPRQAVAELNQLPGKWPAVTEMLTSAKQYQIQKLVEIDRIDDAIAELDKFRTRHSESAGGLIELVIHEVRERIEKLSERGGDAAVLKRYRAAYLRFARALFARVKPKPVQERFEETLMLADALNQSGEGLAEALKLIMACKNHEDAKRKKLADAIDKKYADKIELVEQSKKDRVAVMELVDTFLKELKDLRLAYDAEQDFGQLLSTRSVFKNTDPNEPREVRDRRLAALVRELKNAGRQVARDLKDSLKISLNVELNLGRCHRAKGRALTDKKQPDKAEKEYDKAIKILNRLAKGLEKNPDKNALERFWKLELELLRTIMEGFSSDKGWMRTVVVRVRQLRQKEELMGGYHKEFYEIEQRAERAAE